MGKCLYVLVNTGFHHNPVGGAISHILMLLESIWECCQKQSFYVNLSHNLGKIGIVIKQLWHDSFRILLLHRALLYFSSVCDDGLVYFFKHLCFLTIFLWQHFYIETLSHNRCMIPPYHDTIVDLYSTSVGGWYMQRHILDLHWYERGRMWLLDVLH